MKKTTEKKTVVASVNEYVKLATFNSDMNNTVEYDNVALTVERAATTSVDIDVVKANNKFKTRNDACKVNLEKFSRSSDTFQIHVAEALKRSTKEKSFSKLQFLALCERHSDSARNLEARKKRFNAYMKFFMSKYDIRETAANSKCYYFHSEKLA